MIAGRDPQTLHQFSTTSRRDAGVVLFGQRTCPWGLRLVGEMILCMRTGGRVILRFRGLSVRFLDVASRLLVLVHDPLPRSNPRNGLVQPEPTHFTLFGRLLTLSDVALMARGQNVVANVVGQLLIQFVGANAG